jgi:hypothetical protein
MIRQSHTEARERILAEAMSEVVSELRLVDVADYIAFIRLEHFACVSDIVDSAAELYFMPGTLKLGHGGDVVVGWNEAPTISLDLEFRSRGVTVYFTLIMADRHASIEVKYVAFDKADSTPDRNTAFLAEAIDYARIRKSEPVFATR